MTQPLDPISVEQRLLGRVSNCRECPHRDYYSAGRYECGKTFDGVDPYSSKALPEGHTALAPIPDWCPLERDLPRAHQPRSGELREAALVDAVRSILSGLGSPEGYFGEGIGAPKTRALQRAFCAYEEHPRHVR